MVDKEMNKHYFVRKRKNLVFDIHCKKELLEALNNKSLYGTYLNTNWVLDLLDVINLEDSNFNTKLLSLACKLDIDPIINRLITLDAPVDISEKYNLLEIAFKKGNKNAIIYLLKYGAEINTSMNEYLISAIKLGDYDIVKDLISKGIDKKTIDGEPLKIAKELGNTKILNLLLENISPLKNI